MAIIFRLFLTLSALLLTFGVFLANKGFAALNGLHPALSNIPPFISYVSYFLAAILVAWLTGKVANFLSDDTISEQSIAQIESANDVYLPSYLGYFFVALSTQDLGVFAFVFGIICIFIFCSRAAYFNPLYFVFRYQFYYATTTNNVKILIITRQHLKDPKAVHFDRIKRINDFTFIDIEGRK